MGRHKYSKLISLLGTFLYLEQPIASLFIFALFVAIIWKVIDPCLPGHVFQIFSFYLWFAVPFFMLKIICTVSISKLLRPTKENDSCFIQAMGRNTWTDAELTEKLNDIFLKAKAKTMTKLGAVLDRSNRGVEILRGARECLERNALLREIGFEPGLPNRHLAEVAFFLYKRFDVAIIAQWEVAHAMFLLDEDAFVSMLYCEKVFLLWARDAYYPTIEVKRDSIAVMNHYGFRNPVEVAYPEMIFRALPILWQLGVAPNIYTRWLMPCDFGSIQKWTKSRFFFALAYEALARPHHVLKKWVTFAQPNGSSP